MALFLYNAAARETGRRPGIFDTLQLVMIALAVLMNLIALGWIFVRLAEFGWTANRAAALGLNLLLVINLSWTGWLLVKFIRPSRQLEPNPDLLLPDYDYSFDHDQDNQFAQISSANRKSFSAIINWQTKYLLVYFIWALIVIVVFPLVFSVRW